MKKRKRKKAPSKAEELTDAGGRGEGRGLQSTTKRMARPEAILLLIKV